MEGIQFRRAHHDRKASENEQESPGILFHLAAQGEAAIVRSARGLLHLFRKAAGAGAVTVFTAAGKYVIVWLNDSWLMQAILACGNYVGSFLLIRLLGFSLATKLSSLMAAAWVRGPARARKLCRIAGSQFAAAAGNFLAVVPAVVLFHWVFRHFAGHPFFEPADARHVLHSLHPRLSPTIPYAAWTGILLWLANWIAGALRASILSDVVLGGFLAGTPLAGRIAGIVSDVRHFTLSSATATLAVCSLGLKRAWTGGLLPALEGLAWIAALNFGVSFAVSWAFSKASTLWRTPARPE